MMRRSTHASKIDDRTFGVRIRIAIPEQGLRVSHELDRWLQERVGRAYAHHGASHSTFGQQCSYIYLNDPNVAAEVVEKFQLSVYGLPKETP